MELPAGYDPTIADHQIIATALTLRKENPSKKIILVSNDVNLRIKCDAVGITAEDYKPENVIKEKIVAVKIIKIYFLDRAIKYLDIK